MSRLNGMGPNNEGPMTGRGVGYCSSADSRAMTATTGECDERIESPSGANLLSENLYDLNGAICEVMNKLGIADSDDEVCGAMDSVGRLIDFTAEMHIRVSAIYSVVEKI